MTITDEQLDHFEEDTELLIASIATFIAKWAWVFKVKDDDWTPAQLTRAEQFAVRTAAALESIG